MRCASRWFGAAAVGACFALSSVAARAETKAEANKASDRGTPDAKSLEASAVPPDGPTHADVTPGTAPGPSEAAAEAAYQQAQARYAKKDPEGALESMRESYRLCQRPELLYNLALLERELHECGLALADYTSYLQQVPQGRYRQAAEQAKAELSVECPVPTAAPEPAPALSAVPQPTASPIVTKADVTPRREQANAAIGRADASYWTPPRVIGWSAVGAGVLAGAGALYFTFAAVSARDDHQRNIDAAVHGTQAYDPSLLNTQHSDQKIAQALAVSGSALVAGGAIVLLFGSKNAEHVQATAQLQAQPGWLGALYRRSF